MTVVAQDTPTVELAGAGAGAGARSGLRGWAGGGFVSATRWWGPFSELYFPLGGKELGLAEFGVLSDSEVPAGCDLRAQPCLCKQGPLEGPLSC